MSDNAMLRSVLISFLALCALPALAWEEPGDVVAHRILPGWTEADGRQVAGLELVLAPGWKTYWRSPGEAGIPPEFSWRGSRNLQSVEVHWPTPKVFWQSGMRSVGYTSRVVLPLTVAPKRAGADIRLKGQMMLGLCSDVCIPATIRIDATLPGNASARAPEIVSALAAVPYGAREANVSRVTCALRPSADGIEVTARLDMPPAGEREEAVIEAHGPDIWVAEPQTRREGGSLTVWAEMMSVNDTPIFVDRSGLRITVLGSRYAVDIQGCDAPSGG